MSSYGPIAHDDPEAGWTGKNYVDPSLEFAERQIRQGFCRKVFGLLAVQLAFTAAVTALFSLHSPTKMFVFSNPWIFWTSFLVSIGLVLFMGVSESARRSHPLNLYLLGGFTVAESILVGTAAAMYSPQIVLLAAGLTAGVVFGLFVFACQTKYDLTAGSSFLFSLLSALLFASIIQMFVQAKALHVVLSAGGAVLFSVYLVFDLQLLMGGHKYAISADEYVFATLNLYLDIINLFLYLLRLLSSSSRD